MSKPQTEVQVWLIRNKDYFMVLPYENGSLSKVAHNIIKQNISTMKGSRMTRQRVPLRYTKKYGVVQRRQRI